MGRAFGVGSSVMTNIIRLCFLFAVSLKVTESVWEDGDSGVDRPNGDLPNMPIALDASDPPSKCALLCHNADKCEAWAYCVPNCGGQRGPVCYLKSSVTVQSLNPCRVSGVRNASLLASKFVSLPVGSIIPEGWLKQQLNIQANGLSGHLHLFWADVENSSWYGGHADGGLHERFPYWLNGIVPLAYQLNNSNLIKTVDKYIDYIMSHQTDNGWLGLDDSKDGNCYWSKYLMMYILTQYYEATGNNAVITTMFKYLHEVHRRMFTIPMGGSSTWSGVRWQDFVVSIHWLLDYHPSGQEQFLWDLAELVYQQGFKWKDYYGGSEFPKNSVSSMNLMNHGVNNGMAIKSGGVWFRQSHNQSDAKSSYQRMKVLDQYHGQASGMFTCDEHLAGLMPSRGTELCTVVEAMYSYEVLFGIHGDPIFAERAELISYNALPATLTSDMWAHQYLQQSNEMNAIHSDDHIWQSDGPDSTLYGLAPNYGCCTANFNQGWPKMTQSVAMVTPDGDTIAIGIYAPITFNYKGVSLTLTTDYPFQDTVHVTGNCKTKKTILFRIPSWTDGLATIQINGGNGQSVNAGIMKDVVCDGTFDVLLTFPMATRIQRRYNNGISIYNGPLLYGLEIKENFKILRNYSFLSRDYEVQPNSTWNYAIKLSNDLRPENDLKFIKNGLKPGTPPFSIVGAPSKIIATGRVIDKWGVAHNAAAPPPMSPVGLSGPEVAVTLLPFGSTDLRIAELPTYK